MPKHLVVVYTSVGPGQADIIKSALVAAGIPAETSRVLTDNGVLLWVSTNGEETPIYRPPVDVLSALPGTWDGTTSQAGWGTWLTARRVNA